MKQSQEKPAGESINPHKTPEEIAEQMGKITRKLIKRADHMGPDLYSRGPGFSESSDYQFSRDFPRVKGDSWGFKDSLKLTERGGDGYEASRITAHPDGTTEIKWTDAPQEGPHATTLKAPSRGLKISKKKKLFGKAEARFETDLRLPERRVRHAEIIEDDLSEAVKTLGKMRTALYEKSQESHWPRRRY